MNEGTKLWFLEVWKTDSFSNVWRVEFQLRREVLRQFKLNTLDQLLEAQGGLWQYLTTTSFSLRLKGDSNTTRRPVNPWWSAVVDLASRFGEPTAMNRSFEGEVADSSWYVSHVAGCAASFAARENLDSLEDALSLLFTKVLDHWRSRDFASALAIKCIRLGQPNPFADHPA